MRYRVTLLLKDTQGFYVRTHLAFDTSNPPSGCCLQTVNIRRRTEVARAVTALITHDEDDATYKIIASEVNKKGKMIGCIAAEKEIPPEDYQRFLQGDHTWASDPDSVETPSDMMSEKDVEHYHRGDEYTPPTETPDMLPLYKNVMRVRVPKKRTLLWTVYSWGSRDDEVDI